MKLFKFILTIHLSLVFFVVNSQTIKEVKIITSDDISATGDLYLTKDINAPFILLFHQAMFSRGEYIEIAPKLNSLGFNCLAIDQRSGSGVNGIKNETNSAAKNKGKKTKYVNAFIDLQAAYDFIKDKYHPCKIIAWGSSYSASLVFILAAKNNDISAILSFSPGEYFEFENRSISKWATELNCPVFVTSSKKEGSDSKLIFDKVTSSGSVQFIPKEKGFHGSKSLWKSKEGNEHYWKAVINFINKI